MKRFLLLAGLACVSAGLLSAQDPFSDGAVGVPYSFNLAGGLEDLDLSDVAFSFTYSFELEPGSVLRPGLTLKSTGLLSGIPTTPGTFPFTIIYRFAYILDSETIPLEFPAPLVIDIKGLTGPPIVFGPAGLNYSVLKNGSGRSRPSAFRI